MKITKTKLVLITSLITTTTFAIDVDGSGNPQGTSTDNRTAPAIIYIDVDGSGTPKVQCQILKIDVDGSGTPMKICQATKIDVDGSGKE